MAKKSSLQEPVGPWVPYDPDAEQQGMTPDEIEEFMNRPVVPVTSTRNRIVEEDSADAEE